MSALLGMLSVGLFATAYAQYLGGEKASRIALIAATIAGALWINTMIRFVGAEDDCADPTYAVVRVIGKLACVWEYAQ